MSTERPEFRPIETTPSAKRAWPFVVIGALVVAVLLFAVRRDVTAGAVRAASLTDAAIKADVSKVAAAPAQPAPAKAVAEAPKADPTLLPQKAPEGPNVLGTAVASAKNLAMVAKSELDREIARNRGTQKEVAAYRKQIEDLNKQLADARAQIAAIQRAKLPPPPSDQEQILQMLAPVLRSSNDGRP
jgi:hypothetical protein